MIWPWVGLEWRGVIHSYSAKAGLAQVVDRGPNEVADHERQALGFLLIRQVGERLSSDDHAPREVLAIPLVARVEIVITDHVQSFAKFTSQVAPAVGLRVRGNHILRLK